MYERFDLSDQVFVDRADYLGWMEEALKRCGEKSVVLVLRGIGGIGKSSLLEYWNRTIESTIRLDCDQHIGFYERLNVLAKGAVLLGIPLQRFDLLWQIRQRFVEGVEPVREKGREWAKDVFQAIPFIGSLASIGSALRGIGAEVAPKIKSRYGSVGQWLQDRLGKNYLEKLLEILWKEPRHAEILYLDALLEDLNSRNNSTLPLLFLFDHFEYVDCDTALWRYSGKKISEAELWCVFLSSLSNSVGVMGSRRSVPETVEIKENIEEKELTELDEESTRELLEKRDVIDKSIQDRIVSVSGGNPFVIDAICDMKDAGVISLDDVECLRADTLDEVRLKTWRRLFNMTEGFQDIINRAGLLEFFDRELLEIAAPSLTADMWNRLLRLSFVRARADGTWVFHDLARELIIAELGHRIKSLTNEVVELLEKEAAETGNMALVGHAFSVSALSSEEDAIEDANERITALVRKDDIHSAMAILENMRFHSDKGKAEILGLKAKALVNLSRYAEAEDAAREAIRVNEELAKDEPEKHLGSVAEYLTELYQVLRFTRYDEAREILTRAAEIQRDVAKQGTPKQLKLLAWILLAYAWSLQVSNPLESISLAEEAVEIYRNTDNEAQLPYALNILAAMTGLVNKWSEAEMIYHEAYDLQEKLLASEPDNTRYANTLSAIVNGLAVLSTNTGKLEDAERFYIEALKIKKRLAERDRDIFLPRLGLSYWNLGILYLITNRLDLAENQFLEETKIAEEHHDEAPEIYRGWIERDKFCLSLVNLARGMLPQAMDLIDEAIGMCRERIRLGAPIRNLWLGELLHASATMRMKTGEYERAEASLLDAIQIFRDSEPLASRSQGVFASFLSNYAILLWRTNRLSDAKKMLDEAMGISKEKVEEAPEAYKGLHSNVLCNLAIFLADSDELETAESHFQESLSLVEYLAKRTPMQYTDHLALVLHNYSYCHHKAGHKKEAKLLLERAIEIKRGLVEKFPEIFGPSLELSLSNLGVMKGDVKKQLEWEEKLIRFEELP